MPALPSPRVESVRRYLEAKAGGFEADSRWSSLRDHRSRTPQSSIPAGMPDNETMPSRSDPRGTQGTWRLPQGHASVVGCHGIRRRISPCVRSADVLVRSIRLVAIVAAAGGDAKCHKDLVIGSRARAARSASFEWWKLQSSMSLSAARPQPKVLVNFEVHDPGEARVAALRRSACAPNGIQTCQLSISVPLCLCGLILFRGKPTQSWGGAAVQNRNPEARLAE